MRIIINDVFSILEDTEGSLTLGDADGHEVGTVWWNADFELQQTGEEDE